jgi:hypothetical protein
MTDKKKEQDDFMTEVDKRSRESGVAAAMELYERSEMIYSMIASKPRVSPVVTTNSTSGVH